MIKDVRLDDFRAHLEKQLIELNYKFSKSEDRWREVNHLVLAGQEKMKSDYEKQNTTVPKSFFLQSHGIDITSTKPKQNSLFVLTPFHDDFMDEFESISRVGRRMGFNVSRGDERVHSGEIFPHLLRLLVEARIVVANITGRNPNVFYELGIAHALDKSVILIAHKKAEVPFDVRSKQIIFYSDNLELERLLEPMLARIIIEYGG